MKPEQRPDNYHAKNWNGTRWDTPSTQTGRGLVSTHSKRLRKQRRAR